MGRLWLLWNRRQLLGRVSACGLLASALLAFFLPNQYQATARLMPPENQSSSGLALFAALTARGGNGLGALGSDLLGIKGSGALFVGILQSRTVQDRLVDRFNLRAVYDTRPKESARKDLAGNTVVSEDRRSGIITISVTDHNAERAAALANGYVEELNRLVTALNTSAAHRERVFIEDRLKTVKQELDAAAKDFSEFASRNTAIDIKEQGRAMVEAAAQLQGQLIVGQSELSMVKQVYTERNVRVRAARARVAELQRQLEKLNGMTSSLPANTDAAGQRAYPTLRELPRLGVTYADHYRRTKILETVYELLTQQYEIAKVQEAKETPGVKVLDVAEIPEQKSFPPGLTIIALGSFLAFTLGVAAMLIHASWVEADPGSPGKILTEEVVASLRLPGLWGTNGNNLRGWPKTVWKRLWQRSGEEKRPRR